MCNFASFCVGEITRNELLKIYVGDYQSHDGIERGHGLLPGSYREAEWTDDDPANLIVRVEGGEDEQVYRAAILAVYPTRTALFADNREGKIGHPKSRIRFNKKGQPDGAYESYYENGQLSYRTTYKAGQLDGAYESYHDNGQLCCRMTYKAGQPDGAYESYNENGQLWCRKTYKAGQLHGAYESYNENGQLSYRTTYKAGQRDGAYENSHENGQLSCRKTYKEGQRDGAYESYHENGQLSCRTTYKNGIEVKV